MAAKRTKHALAFSGGPALCGVGQGARMFQHVIGTPIDALAGLDIELHVDCKRCRERMRSRTR